MGIRKGSPSFDERCYALRFDELLSVEGVAVLVGASAPTVMRAIRREHARRTPGEAFTPERLGVLAQRQGDAARANRLLAAGWKPEDVLPKTEYRNVRSLYAGVRRYRRRVKRKPPPPKIGRATVQCHKGSPQIVLSGGVLNASGWTRGEAVRWEIEGDQVIVRHWTRAERPNVFVTPGDTESEAYFSHFVEGRTWKKTAELIGLSIGGAIYRARAFARRSRECNLPTSTRSVRADAGVVKITGGSGAIGIRFCLPAVRLGWKPRDVIEWEWDTHAHILRVRPYVPPPPPPAPPPPPEKKKRGRPPKQKPSSLQA